MRGAVRVIPIQRPPSRRQSNGRYQSTATPLALQSVDCWRRGWAREYFGMDVTLARVIYVLGSILSAAFPGLLVYVILWIVVPEEE